MLMHRGWRCAAGSRAVPRDASRRRATVGGRGRGATSLTYNGAHHGPRRTRMAITSTYRSTTEDDITAEVLRRFDSTPDARLREIMLALVRHLHGFVKEVNLTEREWFDAVQFLSETGRMCDDKRQEFILLSDTLGVSMVVDLINHRKPEGATESTVFGPFHREGAREMPPGGNIAPRDDGGSPMMISGRVLDLSGRPIAGARLDVWQADSSGLYDSQYADRDELHMRGLFRTDSDGRYL